MAKDKYKNNTYNSSELGIDSNNFNSTFINNTAKDRGKDFDRRSPSERRKPNDRRRSND